ncbi:MAG: pitrilysin family protein [Acidobacteriota bacterium]
MSLEGAVRQRTVFWVLLFFGCGLCAATAAEPSKEVPKVPREVVTVEGMTEYALDNGLRVIIFPDPTRPTVTVNITYFVGSRHEGYGESGMAHLLEHMMFKGTPSHAHPWGLLQDHGAFFNGTTWVDRTNYYETMPSSPENLDFALALEADRMINSTISQEELSKEFSVVRNEFEMGENYPRRILEERMFSSAYLWHNYGKSTIGSKSDIERVPAESLRAFYERYYQPDNAMLVVAGKFDRESALSLVQRYFGAIKRPARKLASTYTVEPVQDGERSVVLRRTGDVGSVGVMYHGLAGSDESFPAEEALVHLLTAEPSGRLYKALVETGMAAKVEGAAYIWAEPGVMQFYAEVRQDKPIEPVRDTMVDVIEKAEADKVTQAELDRFKAKELKEFDLAMTDSQRISVELSEWAALGDWRMLFIHRDRVRALTVEQVQSVASQFLRQSNRIVGLFVPTPNPERSPLPAPVDVQAAVKAYRGEQGVSAGEAFVATIENIEKTVQRGSISSGMKLALLAKETRGDAVTGRIRLHFGTEKDLAGKRGIAALVPQMLARGTQKHTYEQLRDELDRLKAKVTLNPLGASGAQIDITTIRETLPGVLTLVAEMLQQPAFPEDQFEILKRETLANLEQQLQDPMAQGFDSLARRMQPWPKDNVRYEPTTKEKIELYGAVKLDDMKEFHQEFYGCSNSELALVGDFDPAEVKKTVEALFGGWKSPRPYERIAVPYQPGIPASDEVIQTPDKQMAIIGVGHSIEERDDDPDIPALAMANYVFGASTKSRLFERLRQKEGLSYGAFSSIDADPFDRNGSFLAGAICAPQNAQRAMDLLLEELRHLLKNGIPQSELEESKKSYMLTFDNYLAQDDVVSAWFCEQLFVSRTFLYNQKIHDQMWQLTPAQVQQILNRVIKPDSLVRVMAGDLEDLAVPATEPSH